MASLGTPKTSFRPLSNARISKGAQSQCPKKGNGATPYSIPHALVHPIQDTSTTTKLHPAHPLASPVGRASNTTSAHFSDTPDPPAPRVLIDTKPANVCPSPLPPVSLPVHEPIFYCTQSQAQAPLALFASRQPYHKQVKYHNPTTKATWPAIEPLAFAGLCKAFDMKPAEVEGFAFLCKALTLEDGPGLSALLVLNPATGKFLEHRQLRWDPCYKATWVTLYAIELGCLCQGIGAGTTPTSQHVSGTNTFFLIDYQDIPMHNRKEICHAMVVCEVHPDTNDPDCTHITIDGNCIFFPRRRLYQHCIAQTSQAPS
jgi:hypothetical protein